MQHKRTAEQGYGMLWLQSGDRVMSGWYYNHSSLKDICPSQERSKEVINVPSFFTFRTPT